MESIIEAIQEEAAFDAFIQENMRLSTYVPLWQSEVEDTEYTSTGNFSTYTASYGAAMVASLIEKNADKPLSELDAIGQITGSIARMGDRFQLDNDRLETLLQMEDRFRRKEATFSETQHKTEFLKIVKFLFDPYERAAIAPHKRLDMMLFEAISNGTITVNSNNNPKGITLPTPLDLGIAKFGTQGLVWNAANIAGMKAVEDFTFVINQMKTKGRIVQKLRMTQATFNKLTASNQFNSSVKLTVGNLEVNPVGLLSLENVNRYLTSLQLPAIQIEEKYVKLQNGTMINMFHDDRVVFQCAASVSKMVLKDPLESRLPLPNRQYSTVSDNLISQYITERGRFVEYEMLGMPVVSGGEDLAILLVDTTNATLNP